MSKSTKDKNKGIAGLMLLFGWLLFILLVLLFYFYFKNDLPFLKTDDGKGEVSQTSEVPQQYETVYSYQTNANLDINSLMIEYFAALSVCDQAKLQSLVTDPTQFNDMTDVQAKAQLIKQYSNINCYTLPGNTDDATIVYVTCNLTIANVTSSPLDISSFYVVKTESGYKINNGTLDAATTEYINKVQASEDIQELYQTVLDNINTCISNDAAFAEFYQKYLQ